MIWDRQAVGGMADGGWIVKGMPVLRFQRRHKPFTFWGGILALYAPGLVGGSRGCQDKTKGVEG